MIDRRKSMEIYLQFLNDLEESIRQDASERLTFEIVSKNGQVFVMDLKERPAKLRIVPEGDKD